MSFYAFKTAYTKYKQEIAENNNKTMIATLFFLIGIVLLAVFVTVCGVSYFSTFGESDILGPFLSTPTGKGVTLVMAQCFMVMGYYSERIIKRERALLDNKIQGVLDSVLEGASLIKISKRKSPMAQFSLTTISNNISDLQSLRKNTEALGSEYEIKTLEAEIVKLQTEAEAIQRSLEPKIYRIDKKDDCCSYFLTDLAGQKLHHRFTDDPDIDVEILQGTF